MRIQFEIVKKRVKPDALWGYPSAIKLLCKGQCRKKTLKESSEIDLYISEVLDSETRDFVNRISMLSFLTSMALGKQRCMAWECSEHSGYHVSMDYVLMEFLMKMVIK